MSRHEQHFPLKHQLGEHFDDIVNRERLEERLDCYARCIRRILVEGPKEVDNLVSNFVGHLYVTNVWKGNFCHEVDYKSLQRNVHLGR